MSIGTYSELKTAIANWLHRPNLAAARLAEFITMAESRINRQIRFNEQETEATLTATVGQRKIALPSGFIAPIELWLTYWSPREKLTFVPVEELPVSTTSSTPEYWTIDGAYIAFEYPADVAYTFDFRYAATDNLSDSNTTNWLLSSHPDLYLYASLIEAAAYVRDTELMATAKTGYDMALQEVLNKEHRTKAKATLFTDVLIKPRANIFEG